MIRHMFEPLFSIWMYRLIRFGLGSLFVYAAAGKLFDPQTFSEVIGDFGILPEILLHPLAVMLPLLEIAVGVGLLLDIRGSLTAMIGLLLTFSIVIVYGIWMGLDIDCGCFGPNDPFARPLGLRGALYRDLLLIVFCVYLYVWRRARSVLPVSLIELFKRRILKEGRNESCDE